MKEKLSSSLEKYLMAVDALLKTQKVVMVKDIAKYLDYGGPTVCDAIKRLKEKGFVNYKPYKQVTLTSLGEEVIIIKKYRNETITKFLNKVLDINLDEAQYNAEQIEYSMTDKVLTRLVNFMGFMEQCTCQSPKWVKSCQSSLKTGELNSKCKSCTGGCCCSNKE